MVLGRHRCRPPTSVLIGPITGPLTWEPAIPSILTTSAVPRPVEIAKALKIGRASVYRVLGQKIAN
jgi:hypothetical protein